MTNTQMTILFYAAIILVLTCVVALVTFLYSNAKEERIRKELQTKLSKLRDDVKTLDYFKNQMIISDAEYQSGLAEITHQLVMIENELSYYCHEEVKNEEEPR